MDLPFSRAQFFGVFSAYNEAVWPFQILALLVALGIAIAPRGSARIRSWALGALGGLWIWMGIAYHWIFFAPINPIARVFGVVFVAQGALLLWYGPVSGRAAIDPRPGPPRAAAAALLIGYALIAYPLIGMAAGQRYPALPTFGLPCPTVLFSFGVFLLTPALPKLAFVIPSLWALVGTSAASSLGVVEDYALLPGALLAVGIVLASSLAGRSRAGPPDVGMPRPNDPEGARHA